MDSLIKIGMVFNKGTNPPDIQGIFEIKPYSFVASNEPNNWFKAGDTIRAGKIYFLNQTASNSIQFYGKRVLVANDTSVASVITGSGTKFSVYGRHTIKSGDESAEVAYIFSGEMSGGQLTNLKIGLINVKDIKNEYSFIKEGFGRVWEDGDGPSDKLAEF